MYMCTGNGVRRLVSVDGLAVDFKSFFSGFNSFGITFSVLCILSHVHWKARVTSYNVSLIVDTISLININKHSWVFDGVVRQSSGSSMSSDWGEGKGRGRERCELL